MLGAAAVNALVMFGAISLRQAGLDGSNPRLARVADGCRMGNSCSGYGVLARLEPLAQLLERDESGGVYYCTVANPKTAMLK